MSSVAVIDDRADTRGSIRIRIEKELKKLNINWDVIEQSPFAEKKEYPKWIQENEVIVLIVDEKLNEQPIDGTNYAGYNGHDLVKVIREGYKELPIFVITAFDDDDDIKNNAGDFDSVINRESFSDKSAEYVKRIVRSTQKYLEVNEKEFSRLTELSKLIALGKAKPEEIKEAEDLQTKLEIPYTINAFVDRELAIKDYEKNISDMDDLSKKIADFLKKNGK